MSNNWRPTAHLETLRARATLLRTIREFFYEREVLELETPILGPGNVPDPEINGLRLSEERDHGEAIHLQTSPELFMKRFLAAEGTSCFQICKAFRASEFGRLHNPEFTLLEWYRVGWSTTRLAEEVVHLVLAVQQALSADQTAPLQETVSYRELFSCHLGIDPVQTSTKALVQLAADQGLPGLDRDGALAYLMTHHIEPHLSQDRITAVQGYPESQAALARIKCEPDGVRVADRFEIYWGQLELANGYGELTDPSEQAKRFVRDGACRARRGLDHSGDQDHLLSALEHGLPECSGVALGLDRLLMAILKLSSIDQVMAFR